MSPFAMDLAENMLCEACGKRKTDGMFHVKRFTQVWKARRGCYVEIRKAKRRFFKNFSGVRVILWVFGSFLVGSARIGGFGSFLRSGVRVVFGSFLVGSARGGGFSEGVRSGRFPRGGVRVDDF